MSVNKRFRVIGALLLAATAGGVMVGITGSGAAPSELHLHLGSDGRYFQYGGTTQTLTTGSNSCKINSAEPLIDLGAPGSTAPGLGPDNSIGVRSNQGGNGTPCSQIDPVESLSMKPGTAMTGRTFSGLRLDLEMTGNANVTLTLSGGSTSATYRLQTGTSITAPEAAEPDYDTTVPYTVSSSAGDTTDACAAPNSSGPNSGPNDNCEWTVQPGFDFTTITLTTTVGTVSLEGGADFGNDPAFDTIFFLSNTPPTANDDTATTAEDTAKSGNVLTNDTDADGNPLTATLGTGPNHGTVSLTATGAYTYTPSADYNGPDSFTYTASDGIASSSATVRITVTPVNDAPVANDDTVEVPQNTTTAVAVLGNDTDVDNASLSPTSIGNLSPLGATAVASIDGTVAFTPPAGYVGPASFTYQTTDGQANSNPATVQLTVYPVICSNETVTDSDGGIVGSFTRLDDTFNCKRYTLDASAASGTVLFKPTGAAAVDYRGYVSFGSTAAPIGPFPLLLEYDPTGANTFQPVQWCINPQFDGNDNVTTATLPAGQTWCIAGADTRPNSSGNLVTTWQVFGRDDPRFR